MPRVFPCNNPVIMGILNVTPDSFSDGGRHFALQDAVNHAKRMIEDGADIIDIGGESTRPFSEPINEDEELSRVIPVIEKVRDISDIPISIDTYKSSIAHEAIRAGADIINDISGLTYDEKMAQVIAEHDAYTVIMHIRGTPKNMQVDPVYDDVVTEIMAFLRRQSNYAVKAGVDERKIILDPGIGFGKRIEDNLRILKMLHVFKELGKPVLVGTSMKSCIGKITDSNLEQRVEGTLATVAVALMNGADIFRVHDVGRTSKVLKMVKAVMDA
ncbi:MAG TPA: dihydropteroate synthase [Syntrophorhabdaceae bacterium]|nr:dihydropteroate synthase [Syntrophorhabdaceae bacterium]